MRHDLCRNSRHIAREIGYNEFHPFKDVKKWRKCERKSREVVIVVLVVEQNEWHVRTSLSPDSVLVSYGHEPTTWNGDNRGPLASPYLIVTFSLTTATSTTARRPQFPVLA